MGFDFAKLDTATRSEAGRRVVIKSRESGAPILLEDGSEVSITGYGVDSRAYRGALLRLARTRMEWHAANPDAGPVEQALFHADSERRFLAEIVKGWHGVALDGADLEATADNAEELFRRVPDVQEQFTEGAALGDRRAFLAD